MNCPQLLAWALLLAAPVFSQSARWVDPQPVDGEPQWFHLLETETEVRARLGQPAMIADFGPYRSWQYQIGEEVEHDDFSHALVFRKSDGKLISVSRNYSPERNVDNLFPPEQTTLRTFHKEGQADFGVRLRRLSGGRVLIAIGTSRPDQTTGQLVLMHQTELQHFYPWLAE